MSYPINLKTKNAVLEIAKSQVGVMEFPANSNKVKYNKWYYNRDVYGKSYPWCMVFVQWVFNQTGFNLYKTASCSALLTQYKKYSKTQIVYSDFQPGDILLYDFSGNKKKTEHTGICVSATAKNVVSIEGNTGTTNETNGGAVMERKRDIKFVTCAIRPLYPA